MEAGPLPAPHALTVLAPACQQPCIDAAGLLAYAACLTCARLLPVLQLNQVLVPLPSPALPPPSVARNFGRGPVVSDCKLCPMF